MKMALTKLFQHCKIKTNEESEKQTAKHTDFYDDGTMHRLGFELKNN